MSEVQKSEVYAPVSDITGNTIEVVGNSTGAAQTMHMIGYDVSVEHLAQTPQQPAPQPMPGPTPELTT